MITAEVRKYCCKQGSGNASTICQGFQTKNMKECSSLSEAEVVQGYSASGIAYQRKGRPGSVCWAVLDANTNKQSHSNKGQRAVTQKPVWIHYNTCFFTFQHLTKDGKLPSGVLDQISEHPQIDWMGLFSFHGEPISWASFSFFMKPFCEWKYINK